MLERLKKLKEFEILIAIAFGLFGLLISPLLENIISPLFDTPTRAMLVGLLLLAILAVISVIMTGIFAGRIEKINSTVRNDLSNINRKLGLTVTFVHDPPKHSKGAFHRAAREIIEKAEKEILILHDAYTENSEHRQRGRELETEEYNKEREKYTQALVEKVMQHKSDRFFYRRIMQFPEGPSIELTEDRIGKRWREHIKAVLEIMKDYPDAAYIKKSPLFLEQSIVIVDERYVIWPINAFEPEYGIRYVEGTLIFDDPNQEFVRYIKGFFQRIDARAVIIQKLPES